MRGRYTISPDGFSGRGMNGCRGFRVRKPSNPYCRRKYFEDEAVTLKNQAQHYEEELKRIKSRLAYLDSQKANDQSSEE